MLFDKKMRFYIQDGLLLCQDCAIEEGEGQSVLGYALLTPSVLAAMRHIIFAELEKAFEMVSTGMQKGIGRTVEFLK